MAQAPKISHKTSHKAGHQTTPATPPDGSDRPVRPNQILRTLTAPKEFEYLVFIGRFQPFHEGHRFIINEALKKAEKIILLVGSANAPRSPRNPFTYAERVEMITNCIVNDEIHAAFDQVIIQPLADTPYNDMAWIVNVQRSVDRAIAADMAKSHSLKAIVNSGAPLVGLTGYKKDNTSYYVKMFPDWQTVDIKSQYGTINATDLRQDYIRRAAHLPGKHLCPQGTIEFLEKFVLTESFKWLVAEAQFYADYKARWGHTPFPVFINCVDAVVVQSGFILLIERKTQPGQGLLALPGGHVEVDESFEAAVIRELKEETRIADDRGEIPPGRLGAFINKTKTRLFDSPHRSERGRVVTQAYLFELPRQSKLYEVRGDDDAAFAQWFELGSLDPRLLFEDHAAIIEEMTGAKLEINKV